MHYKREFEVIPLSKKYLKDAVRLVKKTFTDEEESVRREIEASVDDVKFIKYITEIDRHIRTLDYFIILNEKDRVIGIIGLYSLIENCDDTFWIGWYCVDKKCRGLGIGKVLLEYAIEKAKLSGKKYLSLYTSTDKNEAKAQLIYEKYDFKITKIIKKDGYDLLYRRKVL